MKRSFFAVIALAAAVGMSACAEANEEEVPAVEETGVDIEPLPAPAPAPVDTGMMADTMMMDTMMADTGAM